MILMDKYDIGLDHYCEKGNKIERPIDEKEIALSLLEIGDQLKDLGYYHNDLKPENFMLSYSNMNKVYLVDVDSLSNK